MSKIINNVTFRDPENPSDSVKKYANGMKKNNDRFEKKNT